MKYYSMIIYTQDGEEAARFVKLSAPELMRKLDAAIELGAYAVVPEERFVSKMIEDACFETNTSGIL